MHWAGQPERQASALEHEGGTCLIVKTERKKNGRSLYIVDWRIVVVEGENVLHHIKRRENRPGELPGRICSGELSGSLYNGAFAAQLESSCNVCADKNLTFVRFACGSW